MKNCTGANAQYSSAASCMGSCMAFPEGTDVDTSGNTLGCRAYHAGAANGDPGLHCGHAGPAGGGEMFCGTDCQGFCSIVTSVCKTEYPAVNECLQSCMGFTSVGNYSTSITSGNSRECRLYHATVAATDAATAMTHCQHTTAMSTECK